MPIKIRHCIKLYWGPRGELRPLAKDAIPPELNWLVTQLFWYHNFVYGVNFWNRKQMGGAIDGSLFPKCCNNTAATPDSEASASTMKNFNGSGCLRMGTIVQVLQMGKCFLNSSTDCTSDACDPFLAEQRVTHDITETHNHLQKFCKA